MTRPPLDSFVTTERPPLDAFRVAERSEEPEDDISYIKRVARQYQTAGKDVISAVKSGADALKSGGTMLDTIKNTGSLLRTGLRTAGAVAQASFAPIIEAPGVQQATKFVGEKLLETPLVGDVIRDGVILAQKYPNASRDVRNIFDIVTLGTGKAIEAPVAGEIRAIGKDVVSGAKVVLTPSEEAVQNRVISLFQKSIKPTAKKTSAQATKYEVDTLRALKTIKANSDQLNIQDVTGEIIEGRTPQTINELAQGLEQTKSLVFKQYDALAKQAGTEGATIDALPIAEELFKVSQNRALQLTNPEIIKYAENWATRLNGMGKIDSETAQEVVKLMNSNLDAFYRNPTYDSASKVAIDAGIANNFRVALDDAIGNATGADYQALKNQYSALKAIENDVVRASMRDARRNTKGLLDYSDIFTGGQMLSGILSLNPAMFTKGAIERGFKEYIKMLNDPNRAVGNMFEALDIDTSLKFTPESATFKSLQNPSLGMSIKDVSKDSQDLQRFQSMKSNTPNTTNPKKTNISSTVPPKATPSTPLSTLTDIWKKANGQ